MSRSYRKIPGSSSNNAWHKRQANKKVRRSRNIGNGNAYRRHTDQWELIKDRKWVFFGNVKEEAKKQKEWCNEHEHPQCRYSKEYTYYLK